MITAIYNVYNAVITRQDRDAADGGATWTAGEKNVRVPVRINPQQSPDPVRYGDIPTRPARVPIVTFFYDQQQWSDDRFSMGHETVVDERPGAPRGRLHPWTERANMAPPQHIAYGSLFQYESVPYGMG